MDSCIDCVPLIQHEFYKQVQHVIQYCYIRTFYLNCSAIPHYKQLDVRGRTLATCFNNFQILRDFVKKKHFQDFRRYL